MLVLEVIFLMISFGVFGGLSDGERNTVYLSMIFIGFLLVYKKTLLGKILLIIDGTAVFVMSFIAIEKMPMIAVTNMGLFILSTCLFRSKEENTKGLFISTMIFMSVILCYVISNINL